MLWSQLLVAWPAIAMQITQSKLAKGQSWRKGVWCMIKEPKLKDAEAIQIRTSLSKAIIFKYHDRDRSSKAVVTNVMATS